MTTKKMYWHIVTWVSPLSKDKSSVGDVVGYDAIKTQIFGHSVKDKGFFAKIRLTFLGALPEDYHERYPKEASSRLELWKARYFEEQKNLVNAHDLVVDEGE